MTTGCYKAPTRGEGQDKGRDHERGEERTSQVWGEHRVPPNAERPQQPHAGKDTRRRRDERTRRTVRQDTHRREDQRTRQPTRRHEDPTTRENRATDPQVPTYIPSPCPTPPRIGPHAPCLLGFPRHGGPCRPPIRGRVSAFARNPAAYRVFPSPTRDSRRSRPVFAAGKRVFAADFPPSVAAGPFVAPTRPVTLTAPSPRPAPFRWPAFPPQRVARRPRAMTRAAEAPRRHAPSRPPGAGATASCARGPRPSRHDVST